MKAPRRRKEANPPKHAQIAYQPAIDGLRAVAVTSVIFFHLGLGVLNGGFVGVDIFFVISGYLISSNIWLDLDHGTFSIAGFYERRIKRIFPALYFVLATTLIACSVILVPTDYRNFGQSLVATCLFVSNVLFWYQDFDYFDIPTQLKPLLHTWSLAVEEQFYIAFPLFAMWFGHKRHAIMVLAVLAMLSLAISEYYVVWQPSSSFYLVQSRAWELLVGVFCTIVQRKYRIGGLIAQNLQLVGAVMIAYSITFFSLETRFPGFSALVPVLGAGILISGTSQRAGFVTRLLSAGPFLWIGRLSYSLYLWHWPIIVLTKYYFVKPLGYEQILFCLAATLVMSWVSYKFVEMPVRRTRLPTRQTIFGLSLIAVGIFCALGSLMHILHGLPSRLAHYAPTTSKAVDVELAQNSCFFPLQSDGHNWVADDCTITRGAIKVVLWGDSFARHYTAGLAAQNDKINATIYLLSHSSCPPIIGFTRYKDASCQRFIKYAVQSIERMKPDIVMLSANWESYQTEAGTRDMLDRLSTTIAFFNATGMKVVVLGQSPVFSFNNPYDFVYRVRRAGLSTVFESPPVVYSSEFVDKLAESSRSTYFFNPTAILCKGLVCPVLTDGRFLLVDGGHFTSDTSNLVVHALLTQACREKWTIEAIRCDAVSIAR